MSLVTLTTDFGRADAYVAAMKGVILSVDPGIRVIDIGHEVPAQDVRAGGRLLDAAARWFPPGSVHLAVVDPGVGTARDILMVRAGGFVFVAPDNGLLAPTLQRWSDARVFRVTDTAAFRLTPTSDTFQGRDLFAPLAARLAAGVLTPEAVGEPTEPLRLPAVGPRVAPGGLVGHVVHVDHFGNCVTDIGRADVARALGDAPFRVRVGAQRLAPLVRTYTEGACRGPYPIWGSDDWLEISLTGGSAAEALADPGADVVVEGS